MERGVIPLSGYKENVKRHFERRRKSFFFLNVFRSEMDEIKKGI
jgi:hypothetical protein